MATERNPIEELDYMAGVLSVYEVLLVNLLAGVDQSQLAATLTTLEQLPMTTSEEFPQFGVGRAETINQIRERLRL